MNVSFALRRSFVHIGPTKGEVQRRLCELVEYMKWRSSDTLEVYEHYLDAARHAETLDQLHQRMYDAVQHQQPQPQTTIQHTQISDLSVAVLVAEDEPILHFCTSWEATRDGQSRHTLA